MFVLGVKCVVGVFCIYVLCYFFVFVLTFLVSVVWVLCDTDDVPYIIRRYATFFDGMLK